MRLLRLAFSACVAGVLVGCQSGQTGSDPASGSAPPAPSPGAPSPGVPPPGAGSTGTGSTGTGAASPELVAQLRRGGYVLYIRHAATESAQDDPTPDFNDPGTQRNLSAGGRAQAREIGQAIRRLRIPIGTILVSPYHRTRETAELAFGPRRSRDARELINEAYPGTDDERMAEQLRGLLRRRPGNADNTVLVSHGFNISRAAGLSIAEGDTVIFNPAARRPLTPVATIGAADWRSVRG